MKKIYSLIFMALCTLAVSAQTNPKYTEPAGSFYTPYLIPSSSNEGKAATAVPMMSMPGMSEYTFTSAEAGDWTMGEQTLTGATSFSAEYAFGTYSGNVLPTLAIGDEEYTYGAGSTSSSARRVYVASSTENWMTNAKYYAPGTNGKASVTKMKAYEKWRVFFYNNADQVMKISEICIPITTNKNGETLADLFPEGASMKLAMYDATCVPAAEGKMTNTKGSTALIDAITLTVDNFMPTTSAEYSGVIDYKLPEPIYVKGAFVIELSDFSTMGAETRLYTDQCTGTTTKCLKKKTEDATALSVYAYSYNALVAVKGMFPSIIKADDVENIEFDAVPAEGKTVAINTNSGLSSTSATISKPDWVNVEVTYESDVQYSNRLVYLTITAEENNSAEREGVVEIDNNGMVISYKVHQAKGDGVFILPTDITLNKSEYTLEKGYKITLVATLTPENATENRITWTSSDPSVVTVDNGEDGTTAGTIHYKSDGTATITAETENGLTATCVVTTVSYTAYEDFAPFNMATGSWYHASKDTTLTELPTQICQLNSNPAMKRVKVSKYNYSNSTSEKALKDIIINWNSETNACSIEKTSTGYASSGSTIYMETSADGSYNPETGLFTLPMKYYTADKTIFEGTETFQMDGVQTAIGKVSASKAIAVEGIYDAAGNRLAAPRKGVNIINGKKVAVK